MSEMQNPKTSETNRHQGLDALKGFLILAVIIGHFPRSAGGLSPFGPFPEWIYYFHIPLFLALSCLFVPPFSGGIVWQRTRQLLIPYLAWTAFFMHKALTNNPLESFRNILFGNWFHVRTILWFLPALFSANILMALWRRGREAKPRYRPWITLLLALPMVAAFAFAPWVAQSHDSIPFGIDIAIFLFPFIWTVERLWKNRAPLATFFGRAWVGMALVAIPLGCALIYHFEKVKTRTIFHHRVDFAQFSVPESAMGYLGMFLMSAGLVILASWLQPPRWLALIGRASMPIYLFHLQVLFYFVRYISICGESQVLLTLFGVLVITAVVAIILLATKIVLRIFPFLKVVGFVM